MPMDQSKILMIELKLFWLRIQLEDLNKLMVELNDKEYTNELIAISDVSLRLENLYLFKLILQTKK